MGTVFDRMTEGDRERGLMARVREGRIDPDRIAREGLAFPVKIQIQTFSPCNASCVMCPWPETATALPQGAMTEKTFERLVDQIAGRGVERTSLFLMNEPTLDRRLEAFTAHLKRREPATRALIFTNGAKLDGARAVALRDAGMDEIDVSVIGFTSERHDAVMRGVAFETVVRNLAEISELRSQGRLEGLEIKVVTLAFDGIEEGRAEFERRIGLPIYVKPVTNRAGSVDLARLGVRNQATARPSPCQRPFVKAYVLYNGDMVLCNCDWKRTTIIGNVNESTVADLWNGPILDRIRGQHIRRSYPPGSICANCDYPHLL